MNEPLTPEDKLVISGQEIPKEAWEDLPEWTRHLIRKLEQRILTLEEQLGLSSKNSSKPPSSDPPRQPEKSPAKQGKKRGGQAGRKGFGRHLYELSECREVWEHKPEQCAHCQSPLSGSDPSPYRHQVVELPPVQPEVIEHRLHALKCCCCGKSTRAKLPEAANEKGYGARARSLVGLLSSAYRLSHQAVKELMWEVWGVRISVGSINRIRQELSQRLKSVVAEAQAYVHRSKQANVDETSWKQHNGDGRNPDHQAAWLWVAVCGALRVYRIELNRSQTSAKALLGESYGGIVTSDRYSAYNWLPLEQRQVCWAHLQRDFTRMAERCGVAGELGQALLDQSRRLFRWCGRVRDGTLSHALFEAAVIRLRDGVKRLLQEAADLCASPREKSPLAKTARTCAQILKVEPALWRFLPSDSLELTNNAAERALRPAVIWRRLSLGSQSEAGSEFVANLLTVVMTLRAQGRSVLDFLIQALRSDPLSLLPQSPE